MIIKLRVVNKQVTFDTTKILVAVIVVLLLTLTGMGYYISNNVNKLNMAEQNILSLNDSLRFTENYVGNLEASKQVLIGFVRNFFHKTHTLKSNIWWLRAMVICGKIRSVNMQKCPRG